MSIEAVDNIATAEPAEPGESDQARDQAPAGAG